MEAFDNRADAVWRHALASGGAWVATIVLVEVSWVLRAAYRFDRSTVASALRRLVGTEGVCVEDELATQRGLDAYEAGSADFSDYMILDASRAYGAVPLNTFDERLGRSLDARLVL